MEFQGGVACVAYKKKRVVDISHFYITWLISEQFSRRDWKPVAVLVYN